MASHPFNVNRKNFIQQPSKGLADFLKIAISWFSDVNIKDYEKKYFDVAPLDSEGKPLVRNVPGVYSAVATPGEILPTYYADSPFSNSVGPIATRGIEPVTAFIPHPLAQSAYWGSVLTRNFGTMYQELSQAGRINQALKDTKDVTDKEFQNVQGLYSDTGRITDMLLADMEAMNNQQKEMQNQSTEQTETQQAPSPESTSRSSSNPSDEVSEAPSTSGESSGTEQISDNTDYLRYLIPLVAGSGGFLLAADKNPLLGLLLGSALAGASYYGYDYLKNNSIKSASAGGFFGWLKTVLASILAELGLSAISSYTEESNLNAVRQINQLEPLASQVVATKGELYKALQDQLTYWRINEALKRKNQPELLQNYYRLLGNIGSKALEESGSYAEQPQPTSQTSTIPTGSAAPTAASPAAPSASTGSGAAGSSGSNQPKNHGAVS